MVLYNEWLQRIYIKFLTAVIIVFMFVKCSEGGKKGCKNCHSQDQKLMGDLSFNRGYDIHSLAWLVELNPKCNVSNIINLNISYSTVTFNNQFVSSCGKYRTKLLVMKKVNPFQNTFIIAHPYFRLYNKVKKKLIRKYQKHILNKNSSTYNKNIALPNNSNNNNYQRNDSLVFHTIEKCVEYFFEENTCVKVARQEVLRLRSKRSQIEFNDPLYKEQWHLKNTASGEYDVNVVGAWESGITGRGITVCVIDDGLEWKHPDLRDNYNPRGSYDLNADDFDPSPVRNGEKNEHGTRCAGEIAAVANNVCGVGVAYRANISGIRVLGERMTDSMEAAAFVQGLSVNDVYSCSWGPNDDGKTVDGPHYLAKKALVHGITYGRNGYGAIYVVASGNGGRNQDNCNFDGYANSIYTVTIGAVDSKGSMPYYAEECATMLAVTPSSGSNGRAIVTTDWQGSSKNGCTWQHSGTSAAAPLAAAVIALALEMQPCLSWRDVQYLIALTSRKIDVRNSDWIVNDAGLHHSHQHGFGLIDATGIVSAAAVWESVPFSTSFVSDFMLVNQNIPSKAFNKLIVFHTLHQDKLARFALTIIEYVQVYVSLEHERRGSLRITLTCPSGTNSILATPRINDNSTKGLEQWPLGTVRCWGETPSGTYTLTIEQTLKENLKGKLKSWQLAIHGSPMTQKQFKQRRKLVKLALKGEVIHVNRSQLCHPPEYNFAPFFALSQQSIKIIVILSLFLFMMALYNTLEYIFCYNNEKKKFYQHLKDVIRSHSMDILSSNASSRGISLTSRNVDTLHSEESESHALLTPVDTCESLHNGANMESITLCQMQINGTVSPSLSCEADVSSMNGDTDDGDTISSRNTSGDTVVPRDTDFTTTATDLTTDHTTSEADEDKTIREC